MLLLCPLAKWTKERQNNSAFRLFTLFLQKHENNKIVAYVNDCAVIVLWQKIPRFKES